MEFQLKSLFIHHQTDVCRTIETSFDYMIFLIDHSFNHMINHGNFCHIKIRNFLAKYSGLFNFVFCLVFRGARESSDFTDTAFQR